jgi:hypothetical protein
MDDTISPGGAWRRELLARPLTVSQLRQIISELEHCLAIERKRSDRLRDELHEIKSRTSGADNPS